MSFAYRLWRIKCAYLLFFWTVLLWILLVDIYVNVMICVYCFFTMLSKFFKENLNYLHFEFKNIKLKLTWILITIKEKVVLFSLLCCVFCRCWCLTLAVRCTCGTAKRWLWPRGKWPSSLPNTSGTGRLTTPAVTSTRWTLEAATHSYPGGNTHACFYHLWGHCFELRSFPWGFP